MSDFIFFAALPALLVVVMTVTSSVLLADRRWNLLLVAVVTLLLVFLAVGFGYFGVLYLLNVGATGNDRTGPSIGAAIFIYGVLPPLTLITCALALIARKAFPK
jgi:hypothetical protein